jgi:hypothetical protein
LSDGKDSFHPAVALFAGGTLGALSPQHAEAQDSFRVVVGGGKKILQKAMEFKTCLLIIETIQNLYLSL